MFTLVGITSFICLAINMLFWCSILFIVGIFRLMLPLKFWKKITTKLTILIGESCIYCNNLWIRALHQPKWNVKGLEKSNLTDWFLATSNHQSWGDIFLLQYITNRRIPLLRFFMKDILKWIPIVWIVGWSMNMPFLKRYSKEKLNKNPELRGKDIKRMKVSFQGMSLYPGTIFSFAEGTRFTEEKRKSQNSFFLKLLNPKLGGIGIAIATMPYINILVDFTIKYESNERSFWDFLCGKMSKANIKVRFIDIPLDFSEKDYSKDQKYRIDLKEWLNEIWKDKELFLN